MAGKARALSVCGVCLVLFPKPLGAGVSRDLCLITGFKKMVSTLKQVCDVLSSAAVSCNNAFWTLNMSIC